MKKVRWRCKNNFQSSSYRQLSITCAVLVSTGDIFPKSFCFSSCCPLQPYLLGIIFTTLSLKRCHKFMEMWHRGLYYSVIVNTWHITVIRLVCFSRYLMKKLQEREKHNFTILQKEIWKRIVDTCEVLIWETGSVWDRSQAKHLSEQLGFRCYWGLTIMSR